MDDYSFLKPLNPLSTYSSLNSLSGLSGLSALTSQTSSNSSKTSQSDFKDILMLMISGMGNSGLSQGLGSLGGLDSETESTASNFGFSSSSMMMPLMLTLIEKLLAMDTQAQMTQGASPVLAENSLQVNQFNAEKANGGDGINADCGPASLMMGLHALGLTVKGEAKDTSAGKAIDMARLSMVQDPARDGVDANGQRSETEHNTFTNFDDLLQGAKAAGAQAEIIKADTKTIRSELDFGAKIIVSGTFEGKSPLPWTGDSGIDNNSAPGFATKHFVVVTAYDSKTGQYTVHDPARNSVLGVSANDLLSFMNGNEGAIALSA
jgi:hypothetical protein